MNTRMVWRSAGNGDLASLQREDETMGPLAAGQVRIAVKAIGLNFSDILALAGMYAAAPKGPFVPGLEFAGDVLAIGEGVTAWSVGDKVFGSVKFGAYASVVDADSDRLQRLPSEWSYAQGAAFLVQTFAAWYAAQHLGHAQVGQTVLIHSAAGGVGLQAVRICKALGLHVIGTVGSENKKAFLLQQGCDEVWVREENFAAQIKRELNGRDLHLVLDAIGGKVQRASYDAMSATGRLVGFGTTIFAPGPRKMRKWHMLVEYLRRPKYDTLSMMMGNKGVLAFNLMWLWEQQSFFEQMLQELQTLSLPPPHIGKTFAFSEAPAALEYLRSGQSVGKVVLEMLG